MRRLALALLLLLGATAPLAAARPDSIYLGAAGQTRVALPRVEEAEIRIDGDPSEEVWSRGALLTGFTQYEPAEGIPATERTEVRIFYTPAALYVAVRAYARDPSQLRATLADRDRIGRDDHVMLALDTFHDRRRAYILAVNPLGIQQDGVMNESAGRGPGRDEVDLSPDLIWDSRGRLTGDGYAVELRIPFKSLKYAAGREQTWGLNVARRIGATGAQESWAPISRGHSSRLAQSGTLAGIRDLRPGRLLEINPVLTGRREGTTEEGEFRRERFEPDFGTNLKYGVTPNLTLDATYNPDFSQVEADAGRITTNERFAIFYDEKRPFFLEGSDLFSTPERLVHTRAIIDPIAGAKLTGKVGGVGIAYLGAVDESSLRGGGWVPEPGRALFNLARVQRDVGHGSVLGALVTDREAAGEFNRLVAVDGRVRFRDIYRWEFQLANAWTRRWRPDPAGERTARVGDETVRVERAVTAGHLLKTSLDRTGRHLGFHLSLTDIPDGFAAQSGFLERTGLTSMFGAMRATHFGAPGSRLESWTSRLFGRRVFEERSFWRGDGAAEGNLHLQSTLNLRGNTSLEFGASRGFFQLDPARYARYTLPGPDGRPVSGAELVAPGAEMRALKGLDLEVRSSYFRTVSLSLEGGIGETPIFPEGTRGRAWEVQAGIEARPTDALRLETELQYERLLRQRDGSRYSSALVPRAKLEYQLNRAIFVRAVGEYSVEEVDLLRTPDGAAYRDAAGSPFRLRSGERLHPSRPQTNPLQLDLLFSYQPSPGTVVFLGYGREVIDDGGYRFHSLRPRSDGFFLKLSYLFRN